MSYILIIIYVLIGFITMVKPTMTFDMSGQSFRFKFGVFIGMIVYLMLYPVIIGYGYIMEILKGE